MAKMSKLEKQCIKRLGKPFHEIAEEQFKIGHTETQIKDFFIKRGIQTSRGGVWLQVKADIKKGKLNPKKFCFTVHNKGRKSLSKKKEIKQNNEDILFYCNACKKKHKNFSKLIKKPEFFLKLRVYTCPKCNDIGSCEATINYEGIIVQKKIVNIPEIGSKEVFVKNGKIINNPWKKEK